MCSPFSHRRIKCPFKPEKTPRQQAFIYASLIICTLILLCFYSIPLNSNSSTIKPLSSIIPTAQLSEDVSTLIKDDRIIDKLLKKWIKEESSTSSSSSASISSSYSPSTSGDLKSIFNKLPIETTSDSIQETETPPLDTTLTDYEGFTTDKEQSIEFADETDFTPSLDTTLTDYEEFTTYPEQSVKSADKTNFSNEVRSLNGNNASTNQFTNSIENKTSTFAPKKDEFLVFSQHCKIPNIDPYHPSILKYIEETPPLVCKDREPLTKTEGNMLFIDKEAVKSWNLNISEIVCKHMEISRAREGKTDDAIGIGPKHPFTDEAKIEAEFIRVLCYDSDGTEIYEEYHSFIHDKPKVEKRCKKHKEPGYSVLIIGVDAMSRLNMHRQLKKTSRYLLDHMDAVEMFGFNKVGDNTFPNLIPLLVGYDERELPYVCWNTSETEPLDDCNFLWKRFAKEGYRTLYAEDFPHMSSFNYLKEGFHYQPTDYYFRQFILPYEKALGSNKQISTYACVGSVSETEAVLHWTELFASHFKDRKYFAFSWINSLTHDFLNKGSSADHMYEHFFRTLHESGALNNTITIVLGDHGMRWGSIRKTYIGRLEERLPMLLIYLPPDFKKKHPKKAETLKSNSHRLVTPFDLHATLVNILHLQENFTFVNPDDVSEELALNFTKRAYTLFQPVPENRSCDDASIDEHWCTCESSLPMDPYNENVKKAAAFLIKQVNSLLKPEREKCALLKLKSITDARVWYPESQHRGHTVNDTILTIIVKVKPSKAIFEGTVRISAPKKEYELLGTVSRLNIYGNQSACIQDAVLRKYCYCS